MCDKLIAIRRGVRKRAALEQHQKDAELKARKERADAVGDALNNWDKTDEFESLFVETEKLNNKGIKIINAAPECPKAAKKANLLFIKADALRDQALNMWQQDFAHI